MEKELHYSPFGLSLSKAAPRMVRQAHHERNENITACITYAMFNSEYAGQHIPVLRPLMSADCPSTVAFHPG